MKKDDAPRQRPVTPANDNPIASDPVAANAALTRLAQAIGRHIAREHIRVGKAANDNDLLQKNPKPRGR
jgi:hypothetical protein